MDTQTRIDQEPESPAEDTYADIKFEDEETPGTVEGAEPPGESGSDSGATDEALETEPLGEGELEPEESEEPRSLLDRLDEFVQGVIRSESDWDPDDPEINLGLDDEGGTINVEIRNEAAVTCPADLPEEELFAAVERGVLEFLDEHGAIENPEAPARRPGLAGPLEPRQPTLDDEVFGPYHLRTVKVSVSGSFVVPLAHLQAWADESNPLKLGRDAEITLQCVIDEARLAAKGSSVAGAIRIKATDLLKLHVQETAYIMAERDEDGDEDDRSELAAAHDQEDLEAETDALLEGDEEGPRQEEALPFGEEDEAPGEEDAEDEETDAESDE